MIITCDYFLNFTLGLYLELTKKRLESDNYTREWAKNDYLMSWSLPDKKWLINVLFTVNEENEVF